MRFSKSLFLAFAGLGLFACSNEDVANNVNDGGDKSIVIKLDGIGSRAIDNPTTGDDNTPVKTTLSDVAILLTDGNIILGHQTLDATADPTEWGQLQGNTGFIMHEVNNHVREVHVIGNYSKETTVKTAVEGITDGSTTLASIQGTAIKAAAQQDFGDITLYGKDVALATADNDEHGKVFEADVTINHLVSRIEIGNIKCTDLGNEMYDKITLKYIGLMNYYNQTTIVGSATIPMTLANVLEPTVENANPGEGKFSWNEANPDADYAWAWDAIDNTSDAAVLDANTDVYNPGNNQKFVYQFIPEQVTPENFNVKLYVDAQEKGTSTVSSLNTVTANFTGDKDFTYEPGKIYRVDLEFSENNIGPWNPDEAICVKVKVTVADWTIKTLTPTFE